MLSSMALPAAMASSAAHTVFRVGNVIFIFTGNIINPAHVNELSRFVDDKHMQCGPGTLQQADPAGFIQYHRRWCGVA